MTDDNATTFGGLSDRLTYVLAEAQFLVAGILVSAAIALLWFRPAIPGVPPIVIGWFAALLLLGPPVFGFFVWLIHKLRRRHMVEVHHVNAMADTLEKWYVEPSIWQEKKIDGPNPYPVNGGGAWAVQEFEYQDDLDQLTVKGVWLSECEDTKVLTAKSHFESIYGKLTESHISLKIMRESISELGADIQGRIINAGAEAREHGRMIDKTAVKDVFEEFEEDTKGLGADDLPTLEPDELAPDLELTHEEPVGPEPASDGHGPQATTDGGTTE